MAKKSSNAAPGSSPESYNVGYRRPPPQYQFKPGRSGNPTGINQKTARSMASDLKVSLEHELKKSVKIQKGKQTLTVTQAAAGIGALVGQFAKGEHRARRDLVLICEKLGVDLTNRETLQGALEDALSAEDEALLADFVQRHGGQYPARADAVPSLSAEDENLLSRPIDDANLLAPPPGNSIDSQIPQTEENSDE
jgi:hypothetical protein